jgi:hypothetical protein
MSANAFGSDWAQLEAGTFRFRDPLNRERRFIPLRLDDTPITGTLAQFLYINWLAEDREKEYEKLLQSCRDPETWPQGPSGSRSEGDTLGHLPRLLRARRNEWIRLRVDFEAEARKYHDVRFSTYDVARDKSVKQERFPQPNHAISLWQFYGSSQSEGIVDGFRSETVTDFGLTGADLNVFGVVLGEQTHLFRRMATRAGSLLPDEVNVIIHQEIFGKFADICAPGKPILAENRNPLAKWLNLMLAATVASHPERFREGMLAVDPFAASLTVFDYFGLDE